MHCPLNCRHFVIALALFVGTASLRAEPNLLATYSGKYSRQSRLERAAKDVQATYDERLKIVQDKLGVAPAAGNAIEIVLRDAQPADPPKYAPFAGAPFQTLWQGAQVQILLHAEFIVNGRVDVKRSFTHELAHAVIRTHLTRDAYAVVPTWLREGLAVWCADQIPQKVAALYCDPTTPADAHLKGIADTADAESQSRYAEYGLAIEMIAKQKGEPAVRALVAAIVAGKDVQEAVRQVTGQTWQDFVAAAKAYATSRVRELQPPGATEFASIRARDQSRSYPEVIAEGTKFLRTYRDSPLAGDVLYFMVKAYRAQQNLTAAKSTLRTLEEKHAHDCTLMDEAVYQVGIGDVAAKQWTAAIREFEALLRDQPDSNLQDRALYNLALCHARNGNKKKAKEYVEIFDRSFPNSKMSAEMAKLRGELK